MTVMAQGRVSITLLWGFAWATGARYWWRVPVGPWVSVKITNARIMLALTLAFRWWPHFRYGRGYFLVELPPLRIEWLRVGGLNRISAK